MRDEGARHVPALSVPGMKLWGLSAPGSCLPWLWINLSEEGPLSPSLGEPWWDWEGQRWRQTLPWACWKQRSVSVWGGGGVLHLLLCLGEWAAPSYCLSTYFTVTMALFLILVDPAKAKLVTWEGFSPPPVCEGCLEIISCMLSCFGHAGKNNAVSF